MTTAIVLAGGASRRMGTPKALLPFGEDTLVARVVRRAGEAGGPLVVVKSAELSLPPLPLPATIVVDEAPWQGPLAGIAYGLRATSTELAFVTSCDLPFLSPAVVSRLVSLSEGFDAVVPVWQGKRQPLCAVYRRSVATAFEAALARGELRLLTLVERLRVREVGDELLAIDPSGLSFFDLDTPEDYREALRLAKAGRGCVTEPSRLMKKV